MTNGNNKSLKGNDTFELVKKHLLEFDVLKATEQEARNLIAWLQEEIKISEKNRQIPQTKTDI